MGMDCMPKNDIEPFHANWFGWRQIGKVLREAGADLTEMSGSNDGHRVSPETAKNWGRKIRRKIEDLKEIRMPDDDYTGGEIGIIVDPDKNIIPQVFDFYHTKLLVKESMGDTEEAAEKLEKIARGIQKGEIKDIENKDFYLKFAEFCEKSGGFEQW